MKKVLIPKNLSYPTPIKNPEIFWMAEEQKKRSIVKTLTWRVTASLDTFVIAWVITGDWKMGGSIAGIEVITKMFFYYFHERIWNKIKWGTKKKWWRLS